MSWKDENVALFHEGGQVRELPFDFAKVMAKLCHVFELDFMLAFCEKGVEDPQHTIVSSFQNPGEMLPMLEHLMESVQQAKAEGVESEGTQ